MKFFSYKSIYRIFCLALFQYYFSCYTVPKFLPKPDNLKEESKAVVQEHAQDSVRVKTGVQAQESLADIVSSKKNNYGLGLGIPYGILGLNLDINTGSNLKLSFGLGTSIFAGIGYNIGFKYYFSSTENTCRTRISAYYGINSVLIKESANEDKGDSSAGLSIGVGAQWILGKSKSKGIDFDIIYIVTNGFDYDKIRGESYTIEEPGCIKISIGYRYLF